MGTTTAPVKRILFQYPPLPEIKLCFVVSICTLAYAYYAVFKASQGFTWKYGDYGIQSSLPILGARIKDISNWEWFKWSPFALRYLPLFIGHTIVFNVGSKYLSDNIFVPFYTLCSIIGSAVWFTPTLVLGSVTQGTIMFLVSNYFKNKWSVWLSSLPALYVTMHHPEYLSDDPFHIFTFVSYSFLSYISFNLETCNSVVRKEDDTLPKKYLRMLFYTFYQPYLFTLIVLYPDFENQFANRKTKPRDLKNAVWFAVRIAFWWTLAEVMLHYLYFEAVLRDHAYAFSLPKDQFVALGMAIGLFFHLKYVVIFGFPSLFAKLDNMSPPEGPICIVRVTLYSKIWREFDRGLYQFFKNYIFVPICAPTFSLPRKIFGVFVSYGFVLIWHGFHHHNIVWISLNILSLFIEMTSKALYTIDGLRIWREKNISDINFRRILAWLQILPFAVGLYSNFYFLGGSEVGAAFVQRFLIEETITLRWPFLLIITLGYFNSHACMETERLKSLKKQNVTEDKKSK
ncbi:unnamed protein product [Auanema sp. JU1783]|nr:unnamed protein product [Auanema sp. JU1783]